MPSSAFGHSLYLSPRPTAARTAWPDAAPFSAGTTTIDSIDDDSLMIILTMLPAEDARAAFCVSKRMADHAHAARKGRYAKYWLFLFGSITGFPHDVEMLTAADALRFEARLLNVQKPGAWRCLSCLKREPNLRLGDFCADCIGNEEAFVPGNGKYMASLSSSSVTCGHNSKIVYFCAMCEASSCRTCLMGGACTFCLLLPADAPACAPCDDE